METMCNGEYTYEQILASIVEHLPATCLPQLSLTSRRLYTICKPILEASLWLRCLWPLSARCTYQPRNLFIVGGRLQDMEIPPSVHNLCLWVDVPAADSLGEDEEEDYRSTRIGKRKLVATETDDERRAKKQRIIDRLLNDPKKRKPAFSFAKTADLSRLDRLSVHFARPYGSLPRKKQMRIPPSVRHLEFTGERITRHFRIETLPTATSKLAHVILSRWQAVYSYLVNPFLHDNAISRTTKLYYDGSHIQLTDLPRKEPQLRANPLSCTVCGFYAPYMRKVCERCDAAGTCFDKVPREGLAFCKICKEGIHNVACAPGVAGYHCVCKSINRLLTWDDERKELACAGCIAHKDAAEDATGFTERTMSWAQALLNSP